ncbi:MAG: calcium-binding protein [Nitrosomonas sp.]
MAYNWDEIGITEITNFYLYDDIVVPEDKTNDSIIRKIPERDENGEFLKDENNKDITHGATITIDMASFIETGPGRFALGSKSPLVEAFFTTDDSNLLWMEVDKTYSKAEVIANLGLDANSDRFSIQQSLLADATSGDYWLRSYVWNSGLFKVGDDKNPDENGVVNDITFSVDAFGNRVIHNYVIRAFDENFDFDGGGSLAEWGNNYLQPRIDPWNIGRTVSIEFTSGPIGTPRDYTYSDYQIDIFNYGLYSTWGAANVLTLPIAADEILAQLWNDNTTKLLYQGKPIVYGTIDGDTLSASDIPNLSASSYLFLYSQRYPTTGVVLVSNGGSDTLTGGDYADKLLAGADDDTVAGGKGFDILEGGTGTDTYIINPGDGIDTVLDTDGLGAIQLGSIAVQGRDSVAVDKDWIKIGNSWIDRQNSLEYLLLPQNNGSNDLLIKSADGSGVLIKVWQDGRLGITLGENTSPDTPVYDRTILGDLQPDDVDAETDGVQIGYDELGNVIVGAEEEPDRVDILFGSAGNDLIQSFGGNDDVLGKDGADRIEGGAGEDTLDGGAGNDIVLGGAGSDIVMGGENDDRLYAETEYTLDEAYAQGETQGAGGQHGDLLDGGAGADVLIGETDKDILLGGLGKDILMGMGGDDTIEGDISVNTVDSEWTVIRSEPAENTYYRSYNFSTTLDMIGSEAGDDDVIYGGAGNDWIFAQGGNDFIDAGKDNDVVFGDGGNDVILGQAGDDVITGDNRPSSLAAPLHGDDYLSGGDGEDTLLGEGGSDYLEGGAGNDNLFGDASDIALQYHGDDTLDGGSGDDRLIGHGGNDTLIGGSGNDTLTGGSGDDTYIGVEQGDIIVDVLGKNTIIFADVAGVTSNSANEPLGLGLNLSATSLTEPAALPANAPLGAVWLNGINALQMALGNGETIDLGPALYGMDAQIYYDHGTQSIDLESWVSENLLTSVRLDLASVVTSSNQAITQAYGGGDADFIQGSANNDIIRGHGGNDYLSSKAGDDVLEGGLGNDTLLSGDGVDTLQGGLGADKLTGGGGADIYVFGLGDGADIVTSASADDAAGDEVHLGAGIAASDLRFFRLADGNLCQWPTELSQYWPLKLSHFSRVTMLDLALI